MDIELDCISVVHIIVLHMSWASEMRVSIEYNGNGILCSLTTNGINRILLVHERRNHHHNLDIIWSISIGYYICNIFVFSSDGRIVGGILNGIAQSLT